MHTCTWHVGAVDLPVLTTILPFGTPVAKGSNECLVSGAEDVIVWPMHFGTFSPQSCSEPLNTATGDHLYKQHELCIYLVIAPILVGCWDCHDYVVAQRGSIYSMYCRLHTLHQDGLTQPSNSYLAWCNHQFPAITGWSFRAWPTISLHKWQGSGCNYWTINPGYCT